jgi:hypothetical protein
MLEGEGPEALTMRATSDPVRARAAWAFIHGLTVLELNDRLPSDGLTELAWLIGVQQFTPQLPESAPQPRTVGDARKA